MRLFFRFCAFILPYWKRYLFLLGLSLFSGLLTLLNPYLIRWMVDGAINERNIALFFLIGSMMIAVFICETAVSAFKQWLDQVLQVKLGFDLTRKMVRKIASLSPLQLKNESSSGYHYRIHYDCEQVKGFLAVTVPEAAFILPKLLLTLVILFSLNKTIALMALSLGVLYIPSIWLNRKVRIFWQRFIESHQNLFKAVADFLSNLQVVKAFGTEAGWVREYQRKAITVIRSTLRKNRWEIAASLSAQWAAKGVLGAAAAWGGYQIIQGRLTLGILASILVYLGQFAALKNRVIVFFQATGRGLVSCERLAKLLDTAAAVQDLPGARHIALQKPDIIFDRVTFGYKAGCPILENCSFEIPAHSHVCLAGPSGSGKTTLMWLLIRMADPWEGKICLGGMDIRDFTLRSLKSQAVMVLQEPLLWDDTLENNIRSFERRVKPEDVRQAASITGILDFCPADELALRKTGERGNLLSEGQKQRIAIARSLVRRPEILVLDEAMSSLDSESEVKILEAIRASNPALTIVSISHRLSSVMRAERVYYLKRPDLVVSAPPGTLIRTDPDFARLFADQILAAQPVA